MTIQAYPLQWPDGWPRSSDERTWGPFRVTLACARDDLLYELDMLGATDVVISTNISTRKDGLPRSGARRRPEDPGVAVYWTLHGVPMCAARDAFSRVKSNLRSIGKVVEAMRAIERNGGEVLLERTFRGFHALPPGDGAQAAPKPMRPWREVLGFPPDWTPTEAVVKAQFRSLVQKAHPDHGGSADAMMELTQARNTALEEL